MQACSPPDRIANSASEQQQLSHVKRHAPVLAHRASDFFSVVVGVSSDLPALGIEGWALRGVLPGRMDLSPRVPPTLEA